MSKRKRSSTSQMSNCEAGSSSTVKRHKPLQANRAQQLLTQLAPAGGLDCFNARYEQGHELGSGGCGTVYKGVRKCDGLMVAIKHVPKKKANFISLASQSELLHVPKEVYLMFKAAGGPDRLGQSAAVSLLDWFTLDREIIIVMERPDPSMDLLTYSILYDPLPEDTVKDIMRQLVQALIDLHNKWVFHRDLKTDNVLIQETEDGIRVRIIDFGCGCTVTTLPYTSIKGNLNYCPPEVFLDQRYRDCPTSVWQIGAIAYELLNGDGSNFEICEWISGELTLKTSEASEKGKHFVQVCLEVNPSERISLEELKRHPWFSSMAPAP